MGASDIQPQSRPVGIRKANSRSDGPWLLLACGGDRAVAVRPLWSSFVLYAQVCLQPLPLVHAQPCLTQDQDTT